MLRRKKFYLILGVCCLAVFCCASCITIHPCATNGFRLFQFCTLLLSFAATMMYVIVSFNDSNRGNIICKRVVPAANKFSARVNALLLKNKRAIRWGLNFCLAVQFVLLMIPESRGGQIVSDRFFAVLPLFFVLLVLKIVCYGSWKSCGVMLIFVILDFFVVIWPIHRLQIVRSGACVSVDGSRLRFSNSEFIVTNLLSISVRPTRKTSEWIYVYGADSEIWVNGHRLEIEKMGIKLFYNGGEKFADEEIKSELPVLLRFFEDKVIVAGVATWVHGQIVIENINGPYNVTIRVKKDCRVVVKGNWYEFTG